MLQVPETGIGLITLNRPDRLNALSLKMVEELYKLLHHLDEDREIRVVIIAGAGRGFCSGADLSDEYLLAPSIEEGAASHLEIIQRKYSGLIVKMRTLPKIIMSLSVIIGVRLPVSTPYTKSMARMMPVLSCGLC